MASITQQEIEIILNSTHDGMIAVNGSGVVTLFNRAAERITGLKAADVIGREAVKVIPNTRLHIVLATGNEEINQQQDIDTTTIITNRVPVRNDTGKVIGAVAVFRDITEVKALTEQVSGLWQSRNLLEAVIESTSDAISVADENGNTIIVNPAYTRITGLPPEAVLNKPVSVDIAEGESMHLKVQRTGKPVKNVRMKVGPAKKDVIVNVAPLVSDGKVYGSVGVIHDISEIRDLTEELTRARKLLRRLKAEYTWDDIVGTSPAILAAKDLAKRAAGTPATVLLRGESGTGKELFAHAIHNASTRQKGQFVRVNCAALSENLLESELFGYVEGAFTGALKGGKKGLFEEANNGTIFLDEIGEISLSLQRKLLRVLQEREIVRVGSTVPVPVDVRVITATNINLEQKVKDGTFKGDLYYRLNVLPIAIPPLRTREEDLPRLVEHIIFRLNQEFGRQVMGMAPEAVAELRYYPWPGNVRELENVLGRAMINMRPQERVIDTQHLPFLECEKVNESFLALEQPNVVRPLADVVADAERAAITRALTESGGNREKAAKLLNVALRNFYYKIKKYGIVIAK
ncbi:MAG: sigma-54-dependent transcriptional regulator [Syntrophaceae bacterium]|nr:sigma-54-dependent transcriptional regulator [Syntrophaceae bacterium]NTW59505.1 sigma-54-dependent transcriptional regulator [Nitrospirota bacterium]